MRHALERLQFVDKSQPIYTDVNTRQAAFTVLPGQKFRADETIKALAAAGYADVKVTKAAKVSQ